MSLMPFSYVFKEIISCSTPRDISVLYHALVFVFPKKKVCLAGYVKKEKDDEKWKKHMAEVQSLFDVGEIGIRKFKATYPRIFRFFLELKKDKGNAFISDEKERESSAFISDGVGFVYININGKSLTFNWWIPAHSMFDREDIETLKTKYPFGSKHFWFDSKEQIVFNPVTIIVTEKERSEAMKRDYSIFIV